jgi:hypothetical protein
MCKHGKLLQVLLVRQVIPLVDVLKLHFYRLGTLAPSSIGNIMSDFNCQIQALFAIALGADISIKKRACHRLVQKVSIEPDEKLNRFNFWVFIEPEINIKY